MKKVVLGFLGTQLDARGKGEARKRHWRPTVSIAHHAALGVDRLELLCDTRRSSRLLEQVRADIAEVAPHIEVVCHDTHFRDPWDFEEVYAKLHDFVRAYPFQPEREEYLVHLTTGTHVAQICWFLLTESRYIPARLLQTSPAGAGSDEAAGSYTVIDLDLSRYDKLATRFAREKEDAVAHLKAGIATRNPAFNAMIAEMEQVAVGSREPLLLIGPTGAGKSHLARRLYELKKQRHQLRGEFVEVNCATLRGDTAMSTLFGHAKGAFTGAAAAREGLLKRADGGQLFLDEIGELGRDEQAMLLKALEEKIFLPMGSDREVSSDFQLVAGTNRDLRVDVAQGRFREDLFARLNIWTFHLPGLARRREDIEPNIDYELERFAQREGRLVRFNKEAREAYLDFALSPAAPWHGNFRDLYASVRRMAALATAGRITTATVGREVERLRMGWERPAGQGGSDAMAVLPPELLAELDDFDRVQLEHVVAVCRQSGSLAEAGRKLFAKSREKRSAPNDSDRLRKYLTRFGLDWAALQA
ncbi:MAG: qseF [Moraxellaceae bacterium]|jgi:transcriptional regulatory protein RtcR|nr:qseF [Moraxellaceae bacterium]